MTITFASLGLDSLSFQEKRELLATLWDELQASAPMECHLTLAQSEELDRRIAEFDANPNDWVSWEEIQADDLRRRSS